LSHLVGLGCDTGQGYLISRPQPADALTAILKTGFAAVPVLPGFNTGAGQTDRLLSTVGKLAGKESRDGGVIREARERRAVR
jgi:hypothetical protein